MIRPLGAVALHRLAAILLAAAAAGTLLEGDLSLERWRRWDADIYLDIAQHGYAGPETEPHAEAFLPLFPLLLRGLLASGMPPIAAGLLVPAVATAVAAVALWRWVADEHGEDAADGALLALLLTPTAYALVAPYSEALYLAGAVPAWVAARRARWDHHVALPAALAAGTRIAGAFLLVGLAAEAVRQVRAGAIGWRRPTAVLAAGATPLLAYAGWLAATRGDALYLLDAQRLGWGRELVGPVEAVRTTWAAMVAGQGAWPWIWGGELVAAAAGLAALVWLARRREWPALAYLAPLWAGLLSSTWFYSLPRLLLAFFPVLPLVGAWSARSRWRPVGLAVTLTPLAALGVVVFTRGGWFY